MWYRLTKNEADLRTVEADRVIQEPEYTWHATDYTKHPTKKPFKHPKVTTDQDLAHADQYGGFAGDAYGKGFYTSQNPNAIDGYGGRLRQGPKGIRGLNHDKDYSKRFHGPDRGDKDGAQVDNRKNRWWKAKTPKRSTRKHRLPRGFRLLQHNKIPQAEAQAIMDYFSKKYFGGKLGAVANEENYTYPEVMSAIHSASWKVSEADPEGKRRMDYESAGSSAYWGNDTMREMGYDGMEYPTYGPYSGEYRSEEKKLAGENILIWNHDAINNPKQFMRDRLRGPEPVTPDGVDKKGYPRFTPKGLNAPDMDLDLPPEGAARRLWMEHSQDPAFICELKDNDYVGVGADGKPIDFTRQKYQVESAYMQLCTEALQGLTVQQLLEATQDGTIEVGGKARPVVGKTMESLINQQLSENLSDLPLAYLDSLKRNDCKTQVGPYTINMEYSSDSIDRLWRMKWLDVLHKISMEDLVRARGGQPVPVEGKALAAPEDLVNEIIVDHAFKSMSADQIYAVSQNDNIIDVDGQQVQADEWVLSRALRRALVWSTANPPSASLLNKVAEGGYKLNVNGEGLDLSNDAARIDRELEEAVSLHMATIPMEKLHALAQQGGGTVDMGGWAYTLPEEKAQQIVERAMNKKVSPWARSGEGMGDKLSLLNSLTQRGGILTRGPITSELEQAGKQTLKRVADEKNQDFGKFLHPIDGAPGSYVVARETLTQAVKYIVSEALENDPVERFLEIARGGNVVDIDGQRVNVTPDDLSYSLRSNLGNIDYLRKQNDQVVRALADNGQLAMEGMFVWGDQKEAQEVLRERAADPTYQAEPHDAEFDYYLRRPYGDNGPYKPGASEPPDAPLPDAAPSPEPSWGDWGDDSWLKDDEAAPAARASLARALRIAAEMDRSGHARLADHFNHALSRI